MNRNRIIGTAVLIGILVLCVILRQSMVFRTQWQKAITIAQHEVRLRDGQAAAENAVYTAKRGEHGEWVVRVNFIVGRNQDGTPVFRPGGFRVVNIDKNNHVTDYYRGL